MIKIQNTKNTKLYLILSLFFSTQMFAAEACATGCLTATKYALAATNIGLNVQQVYNAWSLDDPAKKHISCEAVCSIATTCCLCDYNHCMAYYVGPEDPSDPKWQKKIFSIPFIAFFDCALLNVLYSRYAAIEEIEQIRRHRDNLNNQLQQAYHTIPQPKAIDNEKIK